MRSVRNAMRWRRLVLSALVVVGCAAVAACGGGGKSTSTTTAAKAATTSSTTSATGTASSTTPSTSTASAATWSLPNANVQNTRSIGSSINSSNVNQLHVAWTVPLTGHGPEGYYANTPVFGPNNTVYFQDLAYNTFAVDSNTGKVEWEHKINYGAGGGSIFSRQPIGEGPNGVTLVDGTLYGETPQYAFALQAGTGEQLWRTADLAEKQGQGFNIAPQVHDGVVYLSTSGQLHGGEAYALSAKTGKVLWSFEETKEPSQRSVGGGTGTGGAWNSPAIGPNGTVYYGIGNPYRSITQAIKTPNKVLYNDSTVALNSKSGKLKWYFQAVPNDFHDWDMQISPIYAGPGPSGQPTVVDGGKMGYVFAMNANTGKLLWKTPVGKHNGHDNDGVLGLEHKLTLKQADPKIYWPGSQSGVETNMAVADGEVFVPVADVWSKFTKASLKNGVAFKIEPPLQGTGQFEALSLKTGKVLWNKKMRYSPYGDATVTNDLVFTTTFSGQLLAFNRTTGAIVWKSQLPAGSNASVSIDGDMLVTAAGYPLGKNQKPEIVAYKLGATSTTTNSSSTSTNSTSSSQTTGAAAAAGGAVSAKAGMRVFESTCAACHTLAAAGSSGTTGPNLDQLKPSMALVVHQVTNGGGGMPAFGNTLSKAQILSVAKYVSSVAGKPVKGKHKKSSGGGF
jgi:outer membrane protein assembly factor BamB